MIRVQVTEEDVGIGRVDAALKLRHDTGADIHDDGRALPVLEKIAGRRTHRASHGTSTPKDRQLHGAKSTRYISNQLMPVSTNRLANCAKRRGSPVVSYLRSGSASSGASRSSSMSRRTTAFAVSSEELTSVT